MSSWFPFLFASLSFAVPITIPIGIPIGIPNPKNAKIQDASATISHSKIKNLYFLSLNGKACILNFRIINLRNKAKALEKQKKSGEALKLYLQSIEIGESSEQLSINNYAHDIHRVIILYGKLKEFEKLGDSLQDRINGYHDWREVENWKSRLEKINQKLN